MRQAAEHTTIAALKSLLSSYTLRAKQAEQMVGQLMSEKLTPEQMQQLCMLTLQHMQEQGRERVVQQQALLQSLAVGMNEALKGDDVAMRQALKTMFESVVAALGHMNETEVIPR